MSESVPQSTRRVLIRLTLMAMWVIPLTVLLIAILAWIVRNQRAQAELDQRLNQLTAMGLPVDMPSLNEYYHRQVTTDADESWREINATINGDTFESATADLPFLGDGAIPSPRDPWPERAATVEFLRSQRPLLDHIDRVSAGMARGLPDIQIERWDSKIDQILSLRLLARLLSLRFLNAQREGDSSESLLALRGQAALTRTLDASPILWWQLVGQALDGVLTSNLSDALAVDAFNRDQLRKIESYLAHMDTPAENLRQCLLGERAIMLAIIEHPEWMEDDLNVLDRIGKRPIDKLATLDAFSSWLSALDENDDLISNFQVLRQAGENVRNRRRRAGSLRRFETKLTGQYLSDFRMLHDSFTRTHIQRIIRVAAIRVRLHHADHGAWPVSLDQVIEVPMVGVNYKNPLIRFQALSETESMLWSGSWMDFEDCLTAGAPPQAPPARQPNDLPSHQIRILSR